ncbi:aminotransferase class V-fold PLP-dependent enzyme [Sphaerisporangium aureirubrum]|uniref:Aminotransferase class V-fold PLP-dependent enzyme n=1 Tax=Sphaerisporangium aureirubrum TaxID=1544736 RepID=A0ABW1NDF9_9ACTN
MDIEDFSLDPSIAHLNHGSFGAVPCRVRDRQDELRREAERNPDLFVSTLFDRVAKARTEVAEFLGGDPDGTAFVANVTEGVAVALHSVPLGPGDQILMCDHAYGAVDIAVRHTARRTGAEVVTVTLPGQYDGEWSGEDAARAFLDAVTPRTRVAVFDHITSNTARLFPVERMCEELSAAGVVTVVDGAHAPGMLDLDLNRIGADFYTGNLHKWVFTPHSAGVLAVSPEWRDRVVPLIPSFFLDDGFPRSLEMQGTRDHTAWLAAPHGVRLLTDLGARKVRERNASLAARGQEILAEIPGLTPWRADPELSMRILRLPEGMATGYDEAEELSAEIYHRLHCRVGIKPWPRAGLLRISAQVYNREKDYERLAAGLPAILN